MIRAVRTSEERGVGRGLPRRTSWPGFSLGGWAGSTVGIFVWSRAAIWAVALAFFYTDSHYVHTVSAVTGVWSQWDSLLLLRVAEHGYTAAHPTDTAFYPVYPAVVGTLGRAIAGHYLWAGIGVSLAACLGSFRLLCELAVDRLGPAGARRAVLYLALCPMALFLQAVYTESLSLLTVLAAFLLAERRRFTLAGLVTGIALLTRPTAVGLLPALALLAYRSPNRRTNLAWLAVAPAMFAVYPLFLWIDRGDPAAFSRAEGSWHRYFPAAGPLGGLWEGLRAGWAGIRQLTTTSGHVYWTAAGGSDPTRVAIVNVAALAFLAVFVALTVLAWRRFGAPYGIYSTVCLLLPLAAPSHRFPLLSLPRFGLTIFPLFLALAVLGERRRWRVAILATSVPLLVVATAAWARGEWVS